jgi:hypothetical protein
LITGAGGSLGTAAQALRTDIAAVASQGFRRGVRQATARVIETAYIQPVPYGLFIARHDGVKGKAYSSVH